MGCAASTPAALGCTAEVETERRSTTGALQSATKASDSVEWCPGDNTKQLRTSSIHTGIDCEQDTSDRAKQSDQTGRYRVNRDQFPCSQERSLSPSQAGILYSYWAVCIQRTPSSRVSFAPGAPDTSIVVSWFSEADTKLEAVRLLQGQQTSPLPADADLDTKTPTSTFKDSSTEVSTKGMVAGWGLSSAEKAECGISAPSLLHVSPVGNFDYSSDTQACTGNFRGTEHHNLSAGMAAPDRFNAERLRSELRLRDLTHTRTQIAVASTTEMQVPSHCFPLPRGLRARPVGVAVDARRRPAQAKPEQPGAGQPEVGCGNDRPPVLSNLPEYPDEEGGPDLDDQNHVPHMPGMEVGAGAGGAGQTEGQASASSISDRSRTGTGSFVDMRLSSPSDASFTSFFGKAVGKKGQSKTSELSLGLAQKVSSGALGRSKAGGKTTGKGWARAAGGGSAHPPAAAATLIQEQGPRATPGTWARTGTAIDNRGSLAAVSAPSPLPSNQRPPPSPSPPKQISKVKPSHRVRRFSTRAHDCWATELPQPAAAEPAVRDGYYRLCPAEVLVPQGADLHLFRSGHTRSQSAFRGGRRDSGRPEVISRWRSDQYAGTAGFSGPSAGAGSSGDYNLRLDHDRQRESVMSTKGRGQGRWRREAGSMPVGGAGGARGEVGRTAPLRPLFLLRLPGPVWPWLLRREDFLRKLRKFLGLATLVLVRFDVRIGLGGK